MSLSERLSEDMKQAMKAKDKVRLSVIRMVRSAMKNREIETGAPLDDEGILAVIQKELKQRRDSLQAFESAGRTDLAEEARQEIEILTSYLPEPLTEEDLRSLAAEVIAEVGAKGKSDMGKVMSALMPKVRGRADGRQVQQVVQSLL
ncbi:MAG: GatB/YqeY domain-containing protein [Alicyclobacillus macrosporangiidus]|uniref:GatB/YqeY domain-containing protein n=1 Tax=Alicyclobacillus macrosporangiidus TaxID=392015 RepID=UPI0026F1912D|nr:GatB/YqeY domain-containing protein [Alicyclobacillus macrosporangiidus]MCL6599148.1 GatB/YqeY domain-containing protein [Alicyclobacillus macrosporangiidus]